MGGGGVDGQAVKMSRGRCAEGQGRGEGRNRQLHQGVSATFWTHQSSLF